MPFRGVTLRDIADRVGVHASTVSRVLNPSRRAMVSAEIASRILAVAEELGYRPNPLAYGLKTNRTASIGVVVSDISNPVFPQTVQGIEDVLMASGYIPILANSDKDPDRERVIVETMRDQHVDGLIVVSGSPHAAVLMACKEDDVPMVVIHRTWDDPDIPSVSFDETAGTALIVDHLVALGHRNIAFIAGPLDSTASRDRFFGFKDAMAKQGIQPGNEFFSFADVTDEEEGRRSCCELLDMGTPFTALVTTHDFLAIGCIRVLAEAGFSIPQGVSLTGYNNTPFADMPVPGLTTVRVPHYEAGVEAARMLLDRIENPERPVQRVRISPTLVVRSSTGPAGGAPNPEQQTLDMRPVSAK